MIDMVFWQKKIKTKEHKALETPLELTMECDKVNLKRETIFITVTCMRSEARAAQRIATAAD